MVITLGFLLSMSTTAPLPHTHGKCKHGDVPIRLTFSHNIQLTRAPSLNTTLGTRGCVPASQTLSLTGQEKERERDGW